MTNENEALPFVPIHVRAQIYNTPETYLRRSIESVLNQTYADFRYFIVDNGCTDATRHILEEYAGQDNRIIQKRRRETDVFVSVYRIIRIDSGRYRANNVTLYPSVSRSVLMLQDITNAPGQCFAACSHVAETGISTIRRIPKCYLKRTVVNRQNPRNGTDSVRHSLSRKIGSAAVSAH